LTVLTPKAEESSQGRTFNFLGFTHYWGRSRRGGWAVQCKTAKDRFARALRRVSDWCRRVRHLPLPEQQVGLCRRLRGHYAYYGISGNTRSLRCFYFQVTRTWVKWLGRRSQRGKLNWLQSSRLLARYALPLPRLNHATVR